jgi:hypothetical protein
MNGVRDFNSMNGVARQGDVVICRIPDGVSINKTSVVDPQNGRLILLEGENTGHHHSIAVMERPDAFFKTTEPAKSNKYVEDMLSKASSVKAATVTLYRDVAVATEMVKKKILTRTDLMIGAMVIEGGGDVGVVLTHQEHAPIRLTEGCYYVGRQVESAGAEERAVRD